MLCVETYRLPDVQRINQKTADSSNYLPRLVEMSTTGEQNIVILKSAHRDSFIVAPYKIMFLLTYLLTYLLTVLHLHSHLAPLRRQIGSKSH